MSRDGEAQVTESVRPAVTQSASQSAVDDLVARIGGRISERGVGVGDNLPTERALDLFTLKTHLLAGFPHFEE